MASTAGPENLDQIRAAAMLRISGQPVVTPAVLGGCALATALTVALMSQDGPRRLAHAWLLNGWFTLSISLGALFFIGLQHLVRAGWSVTVRRIAEVLGASISNPLILMAPLALLLFFGYCGLFPWNDDELVASDRVLQGKSTYLNAPFFAVRAVLYAATWVFIARWYLKASCRQDQNGDTKTTTRLESRSAPILLLLGVTVTFAAFDWLMSLDPHWFSTIFGIYAFSGAMVAGLSVIAIIVAVMIRRRITEAINCEHLHDVVKLLYGMNCFWAYIAFSQYMLIWYANIPEETVWLKLRQEQGWDGVQTILAVGHFIVPFLVLMPRAAKRNTVVVIAMSMGLLAMHWVDLYWIIYPQFADSPAFGLIEVATGIGFVALFFMLAIKMLCSAPIIPIRDPRLTESVTHVVP